MKVIHIESGLGNQMLSYCEYLSLKHANPGDEFYIENIIFEIPECNEVTCQWNGYELGRVFGITEPKNVRILFSDQQWKQLISDIRASEFWKYNMNYPVAFTEAFAKAGLPLLNTYGDFYDGKHSGALKPSKIRQLKTMLADSALGAWLKRWNNTHNADKYIKAHDVRGELFRSTPEALFTGQRLAFKYRGNDRHLIDDEIRKKFVFPEITDRKNREMADYLKTVNAVAIHARRGDMLGTNGWCYKYGYFRRAVKHIRKHVENPVFVFFTNPGSIKWCKDNPGVFGLDYSKDTVCFVDWNGGEESFKDMQLMGFCKHAIITNSTFGWWGAYFIDNPHKITISPLVEMDTTFHC